MKHFKFLIGLLAFALVLGVGCNKEKINPEPEKQHAVKANTTALLEGGELGSGWDPNVYPHVTGMCICEDCKYYWWPMSRIPRHKNPCTCYRGIAGVVIASVYGDAAQTYGGGCNNPNP